MIAWFSHHLPHFLNSALTLGLTVESSLRKACSTAVKHPERVSELAGKMET